LVRLRVSIITSPRESGPAEEGFGSSWVVMRKTKEEVSEQEKELHGFGELETVANSRLGNNFRRMASGLRLVWPRGSTANCKFGKL
jgi:hypothetical protein